MPANLLDVLGLFLYPQLALSVLVVGLCLAYALAGVRGQLRRAEHPPWHRQLDPLAGISVSVGLLGSVWAFTQAFGGFVGGIDIERIVAGLGTAYVTTGVGLVTAIIAGVGSYLCDLMARSD